LVWANKDPIQTTKYNSEIKESYMLSKRSFASKIYIIISPLIISIMFSLSIQAQQDNLGWRVAAGYGYTNYYGDLSNYNISWKNAEKALNLFHLNLESGNGSVQSYSMLNSYSISLERKWTNTLGFIAQYSNNTIYGNDRTDLNGDLNPSNPNFSRALNFKSNLNNLSLGIVLRTDNNSIFRSTSLVAPYLTLTAGYTLFNTKADLYKVDGSPYYYLTDGTINGNVTPDGIYETSLQAIQTGDQKYESNTINMGLGIGIRLRITSKLGIHAESVFHYTFTDQLDDVSGNYPLIFENNEQEYTSNPSGVVRTSRGSSDGNDMFVYNSISVRYSFGAPKKKSYMVPQFNSNSYFIPEEQTSTENTVLPYDSIQPLLNITEIKSVPSTPIPEKEKINQSSPTQAKNYEIKILQKDSITSKTNVTIENGNIIKIQIENSDVIIKDFSAPGSKLPIIESDSLTFKSMPGKKVSEIKLTNDTSVNLAHKEILNDTIVLENQLDEKLRKAELLNKKLQTQIDSLKTTNPDQDQVYLKKIQEIEAEKSIQADSTTTQNKIDKTQKEQNDSEVDINLPEKRIIQDTIIKSGLKENSTENSMEINKLKKELNHKTDINTEKNLEILEENQRLKMQIESQNKTYNEKLLQLQQQLRNNQMVADRKSQEYQNALIKAQQINNQRIIQPEMEPQLRAEVEKLSLQIQQYEEGQIKPSYSDSSKTVNKENIALMNDSISFLQPDSLQIESILPEILNEVVERPIETMDIDSVQVIEKPLELFDVESIPVVNVYFEIGSIKVRESEESKIDQIGQVLVKYIDSKVILTGMADAIGNQEKNLNLSKQRAENVKEILVQKYNIESTRIKIEAVGSAMSEGVTAFDRKVKIKMVKSF
jgi:outer membrane protein OmpA-like peptidoglycan-associated protein